MNIVGNLRLNTTTLVFLEGYVNVVAYPHMGARMYNLCVSLAARASTGW
jgi:hypothetical protein